MAVTQEFVEQVSEALDELGYAVEQEQDVITDVSQLNDDVTLPGIRVSGGTMTGYVSMKLAVLKTYLSNAFAAIQTQWNTWFGLDDTTEGGIQKIWKTWFTTSQTEWTGIKTDAQEVTTAADSAAQNANTKAAQVQQRIETADADHTRAEGDHTQAGQDHTLATQDHAQALNDHGIASGDHSTYQGVIAEAERVNAELSGNNLTVTNRYGVRTTQNVKGPKGDDIDYSTMTSAEKAELADIVVQHVVSENVLGPEYDEEGEGIVFPTTMKMSYDEDEEGIIFG